MTKKFTAFTITVFLLIMSLCSCGENTQIVRAYKLPEKIPSAKSGEVAREGDYVLLWNKELSCLTLETGSKAWNSTPDSKNTFVDMTVKITYIENSKSVEKETNSAELLQNGGYIAAKKIENGIRLTYYFTDIDISFPVDYQLDKGGFTANIITGGIAEKNYKLYSVSLLPFFASAKNNTDSYVFVPSGSGAIMYTDDDARALRTFEDEIYGNDENLQQTFEFTNHESVKLPVFGVKSGDYSIIGIAENGAESGKISAQCGDSSLGYSSAYIKFNVRGSANAYVKDVSGNNTEVKKFTDGIVKTKKLGVRYIAVNGGYTEMAATYREYLYGKGLTETKNAETGVMLEFLGGARTRDLILGIPYYSFYKTTTINQVKDILSDIKKTNNCGIVSVLRGFGNDGLDFGKLAGGFTVSGKLGSKSDINELITYCQKDILALDFDLIYFNRSTKGFSKSFDTAKTANSVAVTKYIRSEVTGANNTSALSAKLLSRENLLLAAEKAASTLEKYGFNAVSTATMSCTAYSDYSNDNYYCKANFGSDAKNVINTLKGKSKAYIAQNANLYAVLPSDYIMGAPMHSSRENAFDKEIPFYQMVFRGVKPVSSSALNLADDWDEEFLIAVSTGSIPYYTVCDEYDDSLITGKNSALAASCYSGIKNRLNKEISEYSELLKELDDSKISTYEQNGSVSKTVFDNGVCVFVNYSDKEVQTEIGTVPAYSYSYGKGNS